jgi:hypothetical protein
MIHIEKDQIIPENENIRVFSETGDYEDTAMISYYNVSDPTVAQGAFHAQFVRYGSLVYKFADPKDLGAEILKIDAESNHSAASFVRMQNELIKQFDNQNLEPESLNKMMQAEQLKMEDQIVNPVDNTDTSTTTDPLIGGDSNDSNSTSTTTPDLIIDNSATSTVPIIDDATTTPAIDTNTASTTPSIIESILDTATSTSEILSPEATSTQALRKIKSLSFPKVAIKRCLIFSKVV